MTWRSEPAAKPGGKRRKVPTIAGPGTPASSTDPATWRSHTEAVAAVERGEAAGLGFVFGDDDPYFGIDLDTCRDIDTGAIEPWAAEILARFATYAEPSPSGTGVHLIGRGVKPAPNSRKGAQIECYDTGRYFTMTGNPMPGYERIRSCQRNLTTWHHEVWPITVPHTDPGSASPSPLTLDDHDLITRLTAERDGKAARLLAGDHRGYPSPSESRAALAFKACFYGADVEQVARILIASDLWSDKDTARERDRKATHDAERAVTDYTGPRHDPSFGLASTPPSTGTATVVPDADIDAFSCDEVRAALREAQRTIAMKDARIASQARTIQHERGRLRDIERVLASTELQIGPRSTLAVLYLELAEQRARGREPAEHGYQIPAVWLARRNGLSTDAVGNHLRQLATQGLIDRQVVNLTKGEDFVDLDTGEVVTLDVPRKAGFINMQPQAIITNLVEYRRQKDDPKHGGQQTPKPHCEKHPNAGTVTHTIVECAEPGCGAVLDHQRTEQEPTDIFGPNLAATGTDDGDQHVGANLRVPEHGNLPSPYPHVVNPLDRGKLPCSEPSPPAPPRMAPPPRPDPTLDARFVANGWD